MVEMEKTAEAVAGDNTFVVQWDEVLKLKESVEVRKEDGGGIVFDRETEDMSVIDPVGYAILVGGQGMTLRRIHEVLAQKYGSVGKDVLEKDFTAFIEKINHYVAS
jgi:hypothetical protein